MVIVAKDGENVNAYKILWGSLKLGMHWGALVQLFLRWKTKKYYIFWECVCSLRHPSRNARAPYCHLCPAQLYNIFHIIS